jgi:hypothetical protein
MAKRVKVVTRDDLTENTPRETGVVGAKARQGVIRFRAKRGRIFGTAVDIRRIVFVNCERIGLVAGPLPPEP